jgi:hypothetical protein
MLRLFKLGHLQALQHLSTSLMHKSAIKIIQDWDLTFVITGMHNHGSLDKNLLTEYS